METKSRLHEQDIQRLRGLRLIDDDFLKEVFDGNIKASELLLNVIFDRADMKVIKVIGQREIKGIEGHSVRLDIMAEDSENKVYDIEVQRSDRGWLPQRARYNSSMMDTVLLTAGEDYSALVPTYVIFLTENDAVGDGLPLHEYRMTDKYTGNLLDDGRNIIFVNGENKDERTSLGKLVHDFKCTSPDDMYFDVFAKSVRHFKETEGGINHMCKVMEDMRKEAAVLSVVRAYRNINMGDAEIKERIMEQFSLTKTEAQAYMDSDKENT
ncbi:MAG: Rpn family recombination-promoting nuclease/putative transposase [Clostridia bacterium]|nr:Rpn family recombination-promoting nuclease/putative transposase [Clostridia bacterium]